MGPWSALMHTECSRCGATNSQIPEEGNVMDERERDPGDGEANDYYDAYLGEMYSTFSGQYGLPCVVAFPQDSADDVITYARQIGAVRTDDGEEFVVCLRLAIGAELWTERALRTSIDLRVAAAARAALARIENGR